MVLKKGFTLIELIMVIVIVGILATIALPRVVSLRKDAQKATCFASAGAIQTALSSYYVRKGLAGNSVFPRSLHDADFITYISEGSLPSHPLSFDWDHYYTTSDPLPEGPERFEFYIGRESSYGACTHF